jgi:putative ABC transport system ATP-binding protein
MPDPDVAHLSLRHIARTYPGAVPVPALIDINLELAAGERLAVLGKSGSGKSTLLNLLALIDLPTAGTLLIDGRDAAGYREIDATRFRRREVGFVFQFFNLIPTLTLRDNIMLPLELLGAPRGGELFDRLVGQTGIGALLDRYPEEVSGGEQQRAAIVRALIKKPRLLLADEPTGNLDHATGNLIVTLMNDICDEFNTTLVMVTHSREAAAICRRTVHIMDGVITEDT